jgi:hypothetical protein
MLKACRATRPAGLLYFICIQMNSRAMLPLHGAYEQAA